MGYDELWLVSVFDLILLLYRTHQVQVEYKAMNTNKI